jgi:hypothetical protein
MSFLDSLENNLKAMEAMEPGGLDDSRRQKQERSYALATAPWADKLKNGAYVKTLMRDATRAGFARRIKVNLVWIGTTLRLEALGHRLELQPSPQGVEAVSPEGRQKVNLDGSPADLIEAWMTILDKVKLEQAATAAAVDAEDDE